MKEVKQVLRSNDRTLGTPDGAHLKISQSGTQHPILLKGTAHPCCRNIIKKSWPTLINAISQQLVVSSGGNAIAEEVSCPSVFHNSNPGSTAGLMMWDLW
jgi:hypothetical protein